jgi:hypothetical protein
MVLHFREDLLMKANNNVTEALQRTIGLMQKELEQSVLSTQLLGSCVSPSLASANSIPDRILHGQSPIGLANTRHAQSPHWNLETASDCARTHGLA